MKIHLICIISLFGVTFGRAQFTDSLIAKLDKTIYDFNTSFSDGEDLYLTFYNQKSRRVSVWLFNEVHKNGTKIGSAKGRLTRDYETYKPNQYIFKHMGKL